MGARAPSPARFQNTFKLVGSVSFGQDRLTLHNAAETAAVRCILPNMSPQTLSRRVSSPEHIYAGAKHLQDYDGSNYGEVWHWAGAQNSHGSPLRSPNPDTASQKGYNIAALGGKSTPQRFPAASSRPAHQANGPLGRQSIQ
jgi:hypothetical protein